MSELNIDTKSVKESIKFLDYEVKRYTDAIGNIFSTLNNLNSCMSGSDVDKYIESITNSGDYKLYLGVAERLNLIIKNLDSVVDDTISFVNENTMDN